MHPQSIKRLKDKIRKLTNRNWSVSMEFRIKRLNRLITGWVQYFKYCNMQTLVKEIDRWTRRRLRAVRWKEWKKIRTKKENLIKLGLDKSKAWEYANSRKKYWRISNSWILDKTLTIQYWNSQGFKGFYNYYSKVKVYT